MITKNKTLQTEQTCLTLGRNMTRKTMEAVITIPKPTQAGCNLSGSIRPAKVQDTQSGRQKPMLAPI